MARPPALINTAALATRLGVHINTIANWAKKGCIPAPVRVGRVHLWTEAMAVRIIRDRGRLATNTTIETTSEATEL